jgi:hypothetical protein
MKIDTRIFLGHLADNGGNDPDLRDSRSRTEVYFSYCRVLDGLDFPDPLLEFIEDDNTSLDECAAIRRRLDAFGTAIEERHAERVLHVGDGSRDGGLGQRKLGGGLRHASGLCHSEQNLQFMELESIDAVVAMHNATYTVWLYSPQKIAIVEA